jgi:hypothetical protein
MKKKSYARILVATIGLLGMGMAAHAEVRGQLVVMLPFDFVAGGKTLPAGTYTVSTFTDDKYDGLLLSNYDARASVFVRPSEIDSAASSKPEVSFEQAGDQHFLSTIRTVHDIYNIPVSRPALMESADRAATKGMLQGSLGSN